jgi:DNA polymerase-3 subunit beta
MKISCTQENLNQGLFAVSHIASKNSSLPILNNILIKAKDNNIIISSTNLEMGISCSVRGKVEEEGEVTIQSKLFYDYISLLPKERVDITVKENNEESYLIDVSCKNYNTSITGQSAIDFPLIPNIEKNNSFTINPKVLRESLAQVIFAVSLSETRPEMNGVFFNINGEILTIAATDSFRLAEKKIKINNVSKSNHQIIIPVKTLQEIQRILGGVKDSADINEIEDVGVFLSDNQIAFSFNSIELVSRLVEGQYPDYQQIIPQKFNTTVSFGVSECVKAVKTASLFSKTGMYDVVFDCQSKKGLIVISSTQSHLGESNASLNANISGEDQKVVINYRYLLDGLQNISTQGVVLNIIDNQSACVIKSEDGSDEYLYIVMPINNN